VVHGLSRSMGLPHPPIALSVFLIVERAIRRAWQLLRRKPREGFDLAAAEEDGLTNELYEVLYDVVFKQALVKGFDRELLRDVVREPKLRSYNRSSLDKMPDLAFALADRDPVAVPTQDRLFVECKPVDSDHTVGAHYCDKGLIRFVNGEYAWAMSEAMMVGYAREGYTIRPKLGAALEARRATIPTRRFPTRCAVSRATRFSEQVCITEHDRVFPYPGTCTQASSITIRHLWLRRD